MTPSDAGTKSLPPIVTEIVERLLRTYGPERIYLFGSMAR